MPKDIKITPISSTVGRNQVVDELILSFTHDIEFKSMLPGIQPTGKNSNQRSPPNGQMDYRTNTPT